MVGMSPEALLAEFDDWVDRAVSNHYGFVGRCMPGGGYVACADRERRHRAEDLVLVPADCRTLEIMHGGVPMDAMYRAARERNRARRAEPASGPR